MSFSAGDRVKVYGITETVSKDEFKRGELGPRCFGDLGIIKQLVCGPIGIEYAVEVGYAERTTKGIEYLTTLVYVHEKQLELVSNRVTLYRAKVIHYASGGFGSWDTWYREKYESSKYKVLEWEETAVEL